MRALIPALVLLTACQKDIFDSELACDSNPYSWFDAVVGSLMVADDDGAFDYDPPGDVLDGRKGTYDLESGDFVWTNTYADGFTTTSGGSQGYGTVYSSGDADLLYQSVSTDILGETTATRVRTQRQACEGTIKTWTVDPGDALDSEAGDDPFIWDYTIASASEVVMHTPPDFEREGDRYVATRTMNADLDTTTDVDWGDGYYLATATSHGDGTWEQETEIHEYDYDGFYTYAAEFDGTTAIEMDLHQPDGGDLYLTCSYVVDYAGVGGGDCEYDYGGQWIDCELILGSDGSCTFDCGTYGESDCG